MGVLEAAAASSSSSVRQRRFMVRGKRHEESAITEALASAPEGMPDAKRRVAINERVTWHSEPQARRVAPPIQLERRGYADETMTPPSTNSLPYWLVGTAISAFVGLLLVIAVVYVIIKRRRKASSPLNPVPPKHQQLFQCPPVRIELTPTVQQPLPSPMPEVQTPTQPVVRIKAKGLLERRGSNASLTIDLNPIESVHCGTPPKECSAEEFLTSAGSRLTRKQLRVCLKDLKSLHQEFVDIPLNYSGKLDIAGSANKNRYRTIWPNEVSRVLLPDMERGTSEPAANPSVSYINANYMRGYDGEPKVYIATQGPLPNTIADFWHMVWQEKSPSIVMMTKLKEKNKIKCEPYLPTKSATYGCLNVTVRMTTQKNGYFVRDLILKKVPSSFPEETHQVKHYWFTAWPDHKAPAHTAKQLLELAQEVDSERRKRLKMSNGRGVGPIIVHCSAGIGRSGCFIGTSIGMQQLEQENNVDIVGICCQMRLDRGGMIQTLEQYEFLHHALVQFEKMLPETPTALSDLPPSSGSGSSSRSLKSHSNSSSQSGSQQTSPTF